MENFNEHLFRLFILAEHLQSGALYNKYIFLSEIWILEEPPEVIGSNNICHTCFPFVFSELPSLFHEFEQLPYGIIVYRPDRLLEADLALMEFMGLSPNEFYYCFIPGHQNELCGDNKLTMYATPEELGQHLIEFIQNKLDNGVTDHF